MDRFDLEAQIMQSWSTADDIKLLSESIQDHSEEWNIDRIANALNGLLILHEVKSQKMFDIYEELVERGDLK